MIESNRKHGWFVLRFEPLVLHPRLHRNEGQDHFSTCSHKNESDPQVLSLGAATPYDRWTRELVLRPQPTQHFSITMKNMTFPISLKGAHKHNPIIKNRICSSEIVVRKALKSVELGIKQERFLWWNLYLKTPLLKSFSLEKFESRNEYIS